MQRKIWKVICFSIFLCSTSVSAFGSDMFGLLLGKGRKILNPAHINWVSCKGYDDLSNIIVEDFNGDDVFDVAALLLSEADEKPVEWKGKLVYGKTLELTALVSESDGGYKRFVLERLPTFMPTEIAIKYEHASIGQGDRIMGQIVRVYCERSETVYQWNNEDFLSYTRSD